MEYGLEVGDVPAPVVNYDLARLRVVLPSDLTRRWLEPHEITISAEQSLGQDRVLTILIEKDYACLTPRDGEEDADAFPNPQAASD